MRSCRARKPARQAKRRRAFILPPRIGIGAAVVQRLRNGLVEMCRYLWSIVELTVDIRRRLLYGIQQILFRLAALKRIAATQQIIREEPVHVRGDGGLPIGPVSFAR